MVRIAIARCTDSLRYSASAGPAFPPSSLYLGMALAAGDEGRVRGLQHAQRRRRDGSRPRALNRSRYRGRRYRRAPHQHAILGRSSGARRWRVAGWRCGDSCRAGACRGGRAGCFVTGGNTVPARNSSWPVSRACWHAPGGRSLVVHLQNDGRPGTVDEPGQLGWALYLPPEPAELVIRKTRDDGFQGTDLGRVLIGHQVSRLAIAGLLSEMCVSATARTRPGARFRRGPAPRCPRDLRHCSSARLRSGRARRYRFPRR